MSKKIVMIICMVISSCMMVTAFATSSFSDIEGTKYEIAVNKLKEDGVVNGMDDGSFKANGDVTRAQLAKMSVLAFKLEGESEVKFDDFDKKHWASNYIKSAVKNGVILGYDDNTFRPDNKVTYGEVVTMLVRASGNDSAKLKSGKWPDTYIEKAEELNMFENVSSYNANSSASRGDVALMIYNLMDTKQEELPFEEVKEDEIEIPKIGEKITNMGLGDINVDGAIDKNDVLSLSSYLAGKIELSEEGLENADLNADTKINEKDLEILNKYLAGTISILPYTAENGEIPIPLYPDPVKTETEEVKNNETDEVVKEEKETTTQSKSTTLKIESKENDIINSKNISENVVKTETKVTIKKEADADIPAQPKPTLVTE